MAAAGGLLEVRRLSRRLLVCNPPVQTGGESEISQKKKEKANVCEVAQSYLLSSYAAVKSLCFERVLSCYAAVLRSQEAGRKPGPPKPAAFNSKGRDSAPALAPEAQERDCVNRSVSARGEGSATCVSTGAWFPQWTHSMLPSEQPPHPACSSSFLGACIGVRGACKPPCSSLLCPAREGRPRCRV